MKLFVSPDVSQDMQQSLKNSHKNVMRIELQGFGWAGPTFEVVQDEQKENDDVFQVNGVKFVADKEISFLINGFSIIKSGNVYEIENQGGCH